MSSIIPTKIKYFLDANNIQLKKIKKVKNGISNNVYFIKTINSNNFILKDYISSYNKTCTNRTTKEYSIGTSGFFGYKY